MGIMVSGNAVPTAASTLPTAPAPKFSLSPAISTAFVNRIAAPRIAASATNISIKSKNTSPGGVFCGAPRTAGCPGFYTPAKTVTLGP